MTREEFDAQVRRFAVERNAAFDDAQRAGAALRRQWTQGGDVSAVTVLRLMNPILDALQRHSAAGDSLRGLYQARCRELEAELAARTETSPVVPAPPPVRSRTTPRFASIRAILENGELRPDAE